MAEKFQYSINSCPTETKVDRLGRELETTPFNWNGEISPGEVAQGLVLAADIGAIIIAITHILEPGQVDKSITDELAHEPWFQEIAQLLYRRLLEIASSPQGSDAGQAASSGYRHELSDGSQKSSQGILSISITHFFGRW